MGSFPFAFSYFSATPALLHHLLYLGTFMRVCFVSLPCKGFCWAVMHAEKLGVHFVSGCFFLILALGSFPFCSGWLAGFGPLSNVITRNLAAVRVDVLVMTGRRLLHRSVKRSYSEFLNTHLPHPPFDVSSLQCNRGLVCSATRHNLHFGNSFTVHYRPSPDNLRKIPRSWYCLLKARPCHPALRCR